MTFAISIHALREEGDPPEERLRLVQFSISIHALREEGDGKRSRAGAARRNFYPRPPRGGRLQQARKRREAEEFLSTPSARRATSIIPPGAFSHKNFYPRPPRGGRLVDLILFDIIHLISIHALREEGDVSKRRTLRQAQTISIHALREEGDKHTGKHLQHYQRFLSTPSARRATGKPRPWRKHHIISIHALREEGDGPCRSA